MTEAPGSRTQRLLRASWRTCLGGGVAWLTAALLTSGCAHAPAISGRVISKETGEPIPLAFVRASYLGQEPAAFVDTRGVVHGEAQVLTDASGSFSFGGRRVFVLPFFRSFDFVFVEALHPAYAGHRSLGGLVVIPRDQIETETAGAIDIKLTPLEDFLAEGVHRVSLGFTCQSYYDHALTRQGGVPLDETRVHWKQLAEQYPNARENIEESLRALQKFGPPRQDENHKPEIAE